MFGLFFLGCWGVVLHFGLLLVVPVRLVPPHRQPHRLVRLNLAVLCLWARSHPCNLELGCWRRSGNEMCVANILLASFCTVVRRYVGEREHWGWCRPFRVRRGVEIDGSHLDLANDWHLVILCPLVPKGMRRPSSIQHTSVLCQYILGGCMLPTREGT